MADKEKKRKRHEDAGDRPSKKTAAAQPTGTVRVEMLENRDVLNPVLASTPGLQFPSNISFKPYRQTKILPGGASHNLLLQSSEHPRLDYTASEERDGSSESLLKDYIGVFDPATKKLQIIPVQKLTLRSTLRSEMDELREEKERIEAAKGSMTARRHALATEFGSRRSKKAIAEMAENAIARGHGKDPQLGARNEVVSSAVLRNMEYATGSMPTKEDLAAAVDSSKPRPPANLAAEYPSGVYTIDAIVGQDLMGLIPVKDWVDAATSGQDIQVHSQYVARKMLKLVKAKELQKLKVLRFILCCINFNAALKQKGKGPKTVPPKEQLMKAMGEDTPAPVVDSIKRRFASENNDMPRWNIDNLMTHIAAAALIVDNFEVDVNDLRDDLKLENKEIRQYFHEIGSTVKPPTETERTKLKISKAETVNHNIAKLKLPLNFPKVKTGPPKRGRR